MINVSNYCGAERDDTCIVYNHLVVCAHATHMPS